MFYSPWVWEAMIFPPACVTFCSADFEYDATCMVRGLVIFPVPKSLVYPSSVRLISDPWASWSSLTRLIAFTLVCRLWGEVKPCFPK